MQILGDCVDIPRGAQLSMVAPEAMCVCKGFLGGGTLMRLEFPAHKKSLFLFFVVFGEGLTQTSGG